MKRALGLALLCMVLAFPVTARGDGISAGNWKLVTLSPLGNQETTSLVLKLETKDGKTEASLVKAGKGSQDLIWFSVAGSRVFAAVKGTEVQVFEGELTSDGKRILGVFGNSKSLSAAYLAPTTETSITAKAAKEKLTGTAQEVKALAVAAASLARGHGAAVEAEINSQLAVAFLTRKMPDEARQFAASAEKALTTSMSSKLQLQVLQAARAVFEHGGASADAASVRERLEKLEKPLDEEYHSRVPPFKAEKFAGRKGQSEHVAVMELFTGAQCPPCVASDVAFDVLETTYSPRDLILLEYHLHIPGPDPMTNSDTQARARRYDVKATPSVLFNGTIKQVGGGAMAGAEKKYEQYRKVIDGLLEKPAPCTVTASAKRVGDAIKIKTRVAGLEDFEKKRLHVILVEESIRFLGSNGVRFHHQVVRALPGGVEGVPITKAAMSAENSVDLKQLRQNLTAYLDNYAANTKLFPQLPRPLDFNGLRVVAMVQDEATNEILQAVQVEVE
jgi:hypothetical protein